MVTSHDQGRPGPKSVPGRAMADFDIEVFCAPRALSANPR